MLRCAHLSAENPQVLLWGASEDLQALAAMLSRLAEREVLFDGTAAEAPQRLILILEEDARGMMLNGSELQWEMGAADRLRFSQLVDAVAASPMPCHSYLDCSTGEGIEVKISLGEYPADWKP